MKQRIAAVLRRWADRLAPVERPSVAQYNMQIQAIDYDKLAGFIDKMRRAKS